ncbi:MAG: hypothetical protein V7K41_13920 [Nostoc sp.]|uniref:hypothetical protein n=1 Tax=Nostoc sp. TaxID=1180 RepID=UPI002FFA8044
MHEINNDDPIIIIPSPNNTLVLISLMCNSTLAGENNPDHVLLKVQGKDEHSWSYTMYAGQDVPLSGSVNFNDTAFIEIDIGRTKIGPYPVSNNGKTSQQFQEGEADYILQYQVKPSS